jgi:predicted Rossmann fold flavoprotein
MKLGIIGAGAAGIFATKFLHNFKGEIHLFEANDHIGKKLSITGGGRMNLTNKHLDASHFFSENQRAVKHIFKHSLARNYLKLFDELNINLKWEKNRALLHSENALKQVQEWENEFKKQENLTLHLNTKIEDIQIVNNKFVLKKKNGKSFSVDILLITSGGALQLFDKKTIEQKNYSLLKNIPHSIIPLKPCLSPITIPSSPFKSLAGTALNIELRQKKFSTIDALLFTHKGISGPAVLDFSAQWDGNDCEINFLPEENEERFSESFQTLRSGKTRLTKFLQNYLPKKVALFHVEKLNATEKMIADISKEDFKTLRKNLFHWQIQNGVRGNFCESWTTRGGINMNEVNTSTMESKLIPNIFFAGEILDVNGLCGGYNITFAALSARMACEEILKR